MSILYGRIVAGRGVGMEHVRAAIDELEIIIGERPYPGTLNVLLDRPAKLLESAASYFDGGHRMLWPARMNGTRVWLYRWPHAPLHVAEIIAGISLRDEYGLGTDARVEIEVPDTFLGKVPQAAWAIIWKGREDLVYRNDRYNRLTARAAIRTGLGLDPLNAVIKKTAAGILRKLSLRKRAPTYPFSRLETGPSDAPNYTIRQIFNLLGYTKTSNSSYSAQKYPAGYHSIAVHGRRLDGQRDPAARLAQVPFDFAGKSVLDLGSNQGGMLLELADHLKWGVGVDFDHRMVNAANRIRAVNGASQLNFYVFDLQRENLQIIRDFLPEEGADICFLLSVCMWLTNWKDVINFAASIAKAVLFESNGSDEHQKEQIDYLREIFPNIALLAGESLDDAGQRNRKLLLAAR